MTLTIHCTDGTKQVLGLHPSFAIDQIGKDRTRILTDSEINKKAEDAALEIVKGLYKYHTLSGLAEDTKEMRELRV